MRAHQAESASRDLLTTLWLGWLVFVVYGSLVPLDFKAVSLSEAWERFAQIRLLDVGLQGRADWVANGVLYVPVGALGTLVFAGGLDRRRWVGGGVALLSGVGLALVVEFTQLFFPPRTVSLNDLLAETLGCLLGVAVAAMGMRHWLEALDHWHGQRQQLTGAVLPLGVAVLLLYSLFPFDLLVSGNEFGRKLTSDFWGWWLAPLSARDGMGALLLRLLAEALVMLPLGAWWAHRRATHQATTTGTAVWPAAMGGALRGAAFGVLLELCQLFVASGVSQGVSVLSRSAGWGLGAVLGVLTLALLAQDWRALLRRWTALVLVGCTLAAMAKAGWWSTGWAAADQAWARLSSGEIRFLPFYYHYFTSEGAALQSTAPVVLLFAPWGLLAWAWHRSPWMAGLGAGVVAAVVEAGRLFLPAVRPDPTNALIAGASAAAVAWLFRGWSARREPVAGMGQAQKPRLPEQRAPALEMPSANTGAGRSPVLWLVVGMALLWLWRFPVHQAVAGLLLMMGAALVWWRPVGLLAVVVAALPMLNLTIWSGREYVDEFDMLVLLCVAVAWARRSPQQPRHRAGDAVGTAVVVAVGLSLFASALLGWAPWDLSGLAHPHSPLSPWYSLRLFKGALLAVLVVVVIRQQLAAGEPVTKALEVGMVLGLAGVLAWVLWERNVFVGLLNFAAEYRVAGPVLPMRLGGAYLDVFLAVSLPFALSGALYGRHGGWRTLCAVTALGGVYTMAVTFTRSTYLAVALAIAVVALGALRSGSDRGARRWWTVAGLMSLLLVIAYPIVTGPFASARMAVVAQDMGDPAGACAPCRVGARLGCGDASAGAGAWALSGAQLLVRQMSTDSSGGMGVHQFLQQEGVSVLQLGAGPMLYLDQAVTADVTEQAHVVVRVRSSGPGGKLVVALCEKWLLASGTCASHTFVMREADTGWQDLSATLKTGELNLSSGWLKRPTRISIYNAGLTRLDIDTITLLDAQGRQLVRNGGFDQAGDHWSYTSDDHLAWHVKNMAQAVWFDLGGLGVLALGAFLVLAFSRCARSAWKGDRSAQASLAALSGLMVVAMFDFGGGRAALLAAAVAGVVAGFASARRTRRSDGMSAAAADRPRDAAELFVSQPWFDNLLAHGFDQVVTPVACRWSTSEGPANLPLMREGARGPLRSVANYYSGLFGPVASEQQLGATDWDEVARQLRHAPGSAVLQIQPLDVDSTWLPQLEAGLRRCGLPHGSLLLLRQPVPAGRTWAV